MSLFRKSSAFLLALVAYATIATPDAVGLEAASHSTEAPQETMQVEINSFDGTMYGPFTLPITVTVLDLAKKLETELKMGHGVQAVLVLGSQRLNCHHTLSRLRDAEPHKPLRLNMVKELVWPGIAKVGKLKRICGNYQYYCSLTYYKTKEPTGTYLVSLTDYMKELEGLDESWKSRSALICPTKTFYDYTERALYCIEDDLYLFEIRITKDWIRCCRNCIPGTKKMEQDAIFSELFGVSLVDDKSGVANAELDISPIEALLRLHDFLSTQATKAGVPCTDKRGEIVSPYLPNYIRGQRELLNSRA